MPRLAFVAPTALGSSTFRSVRLGGGGCVRRGYAARRWRDVGIRRDWAALSPPPADVSASARTLRAALGGAMAAQLTAASSPLSPAFVSTLPPLQQAVWFTGLVGAIGALTVFLTKNNYRNIDSPRLLARVLGPVFIAAGLSHFQLHAAFVDMYPSAGAWGLWFLPGSADFHVNWTGVAEILGGIGVLLGDRSFAPKRVGALAALGLFALTAAVTPSNIFMFTHAKLGPVMHSEPDFAIPWYGHAVRLLVMQPLLLAVLWRLSRSYPERE